MVHWSWCLDVNPVKDRWKFNKFAVVISWLCNHKPNCEEFQEATLINGIPSGNPTAPDLSLICFTLSSLKTLLQISLSRLSQVINEPIGVNQWWVSRVNYQSNLKLLPLLYQALSWWRLVGQMCPYTLQYLWNFNWIQHFQMYRFKIREVRAWSDQEL